MRRLDQNGQDVTDFPALWEPSDCEVVATNFAHPSITTGQHTNGPASIWIRRAETGEWLNTGMKSMHKVREAWCRSGMKEFQA